MIDKVANVFYSRFVLSIWAKTLASDKITRSLMFKRVDKKFDPRLLFDYLSEICHELDIPTPVILITHERHFDEFNVVRFRAADFVEAIDFDVLILENSSS